MDVRLYLGWCCAWKGWLRNAGPGGDLVEGVACRLSGTIGFIFLVSTACITLILLSIDAGRTLKQSAHRMIKVSNSTQVVE
jgi:hypothetical protein